MRVTSIMLAVIIGFAGVASAQSPGQYPPPQYPQQPQQQYPQQYPQQQYPQQQYPQYGYPQQQPPMNVQLTVDEQWLLERGYISDGEHIGGGLAALFVGFGVGQAVQGRWGRKGYIFTFGELASFGVMIYGMVHAFNECNNIDSSTCDSGFQQGAYLMFGGAIALTVFRVWEIVDAFAEPPSHNRQVTQLRTRLGLPVPMYSRIMPYMAPTHLGDGGVAGVSFRF